MMKDELLLICWLFRGVNWKIVNLVV